MSLLDHSESNPVVADEVSGDTGLFEEPVNMMVIEFEGVPEPDVKTSELSLENLEVLDGSIEVGGTGGAELPCLAVAPGVVVVEGSVFVVALTGITDVLLELIEVFGRLQHCIAKRSALVHSTPRKRGITLWSRTKVLRYSHPALLRAPRIIDIMTVKVTEDA